MPNKVKPPPTHPPQSSTLPPCPAQVGGGGQHAHGVDHAGQDAVAGGAEGSGAVHPRLHPLRPRRHPHPHHLPSPRLCGERRRRYCRTGMGQPAAAPPVRAPQSTAGQQSTCCILVNSCMTGGLGAPGSATSMQATQPTVTCANSCAPSGRQGHPGAHCVRFQRHGHDGGASALHRRGLPHPEPGGGWRLGASWQQCLLRIAAWRRAQPLVAGQGVVCLGLLASDVRQQRQEASQPAMRPLGKE